MTTLSKIAFRLNGRDVAVAVEPDTPLLWVLRDEFGLTGTKYGCGIAACGACTVHIAGEAMRACSVPVESVAGQEVTTIEAPPDARMRALRAAWIEEQVPQCGYCQSGMLMAASALLAATKKPSDADIDAAISNICRCGTYPRVRTAIHRAAQILAG